MIDECFYPENLCGQDLQTLRELSRQLPRIAELCASEMFIDCFSADGCVVADHTWSAQTGSLYRACAIGKHVREQDEPAVFAAWRTGIVQRDLKAVTQEGRTVWQDVAPVFGIDGRCIALLIREKDVSERIAREKKYATLAKSYAEEAPTLRDEPRENESLWQREIHHRVKNNLQTIASILSMQARRCADSQSAEILHENVERVLSMASIHDILLSDKTSQQRVDSVELLQTLLRNLQAMILPGKSIELSLQADHVLFTQQTATDLAMVVCELVTNALRHAFTDRQNGRVELILKKGIEHHSICVCDDGVGFSNATKDAFGLQIVRATVSQKLHGCVRIQPSNPGTTVIFDCKTE